MTPNDHLEGELIKSRSLGEKLQEAFEAKLKQATPCVRCEGRGYHHGFGEHGHDPDWCEVCGGSGFDSPTDAEAWIAAGSAALAFVASLSEGDQGGLVERLRRMSTAYEAATGTRNHIMDEAADAITAAQVRIGELEGENRVLIGVLAAEREAMARIQADHGRIFNLAQAAEARAEQAEARLAKVLEEAAQIAERDTDWTALARQQRTDRKGDDANALAWTAGPDEDHSPSHQNVRAYQHGILVGRAIAATIRRASEGLGSGEKL